MYTSTFTFAKSVFGDEFYEIHPWLPGRGGLGEPNLIRLSGLCRHCRVAPNFARAIDVCSLQQHGHQ